MRLLTIAISFLLITGCGVIDEVNQTVDYGKKTKDYISTMAGYQDDVSNYMNKEQLTEQDIEDIKVLIDEVEAEINEFNEIEPPSVASGIHDEIEAKNNEVLKATEEAKRQINQGQFDASAFENLEIAKTLAELKAYKEQIDQVMN